MTHEGDQHMPERDTPADEWGIVELFGHVRLAGRIAEVERYGGKMLQLDIPGDDGAIVATQLIGHGALYRVTPTSEEIARRAVELSRPRPVAALAAQADEYDEDDGLDDGPF